SAVITQPSGVAAPAVCGANVTDSVTVAPGATDVPSASVDAAVNVPSAGGFDFVIVSVAPPVLRSVKESVLLIPTSTGPKSSDLVERVATPGAAAVPESPTPLEPPSVATSISPVNEPAAVGANETVAITDEPAAIVPPTAGRPLT